MENFSFRWISIQYISIYFSAIMILNGKAKESFQHSNFNRWDLWGELHPRAFIIQRTWAFSTAWLNPFGDFQLRDECQCNLISTFLLPCLSHYATISQLESSTRSSFRVSTNFLRSWFNIIKLHFLWISSRSAVNLSYFIFQDFFHFGLQKYFLYVSINKTSSSK